MHVQTWGCLSRPEGRMGKKRNIRKPREKFSKAQRQSLTDEEWAALEKRVTAQSPVSAWSNAIRAVGVDGPARGGVGYKR